MEKSYISIRKLKLPMRKIQVLSCFRKLDIPGTSILFKNMVIIIFNIKINRYFCNLLSKTMVNVQVKLISLWFDTIICHYGAKLYN